MYIEHVSQAGNGRGDLPPEQPGSNICHVHNTCSEIAAALTVNPTLYRASVKATHQAPHPYLHTGGRVRADNLIHDWLGRPPAESFGGNYGEPSPTSLCYTFEGAGGKKPFCSMTPDTVTGIPNNLSSLTM
jgi:hypothetical protein